MTPIVRQKKKRSVGKHMLHGSFWMISARWASRLTGVVSTVILARLLTPSDFGIVAMAMIVIGLLEVLNPSGQKLALIRLINPTREHYDTVWTLSVIVGLAIAAVIVAIAPLTLYYYHDGRAIPVMQCLAMRSAIGGFENVGVLDFRRELRFDRVFLYSIYPKLISFLVTVISAILLRSYWALVAGILTISVATNILSFAMHPYRPRFSLAKIDELWSFSFWTMFRSIGWSLNFQIDQLVIGGISGAASMGRYAVASDVASSPSRELNDPMVGVLYPVMITVQHDRMQLRALYLKILCWSAIICSSTSVGVALVGHDLTWVLLGPKWHDIAPLITPLALSAGLLGLSSGAYATFDAIGRPGLGARMQWLRLIFLCLAIVPMGLLYHSLQIVAAARFFVTLVFMPTLFLAVGAAIGVTASDYGAALWRPFFSSGIMAVGVWMMNSAVVLEGILRLTLDVVVGGSVFLMSLFFLWRFSGRPDSPEKDVLTLAGSFWTPVQVSSLKDEAHGNAVD